MPSRIAGRSARRRETPYRSSGYVKPIGIRGAAAEKAARLSWWNELTTARSESPCRDEPVGDLVEARRQLQVDVDADVVPGQEVEGVVERRQLRGDLPQLREGALADAARGCAMADLGKVVRVREHERPVREVEHVELDRVDTACERGLERAQRVLGRDRRRAAVADP